MILLTIKIFPILAVMISAWAFFCPQAFVWMGGWVVPLLGIIMLGMGATLSLSDFVRAIQKPRAVLTGLVLQFAVMPLAAFLIAHLLGLPREQLIGVVMVGVVAGGTASNVITFLAGGDVALSITMTACSTLAGIVLTPLLTALYLGRTVDVPSWAMFQSILLIVALPVILGLTLKRLLRKFDRYLELASPLVSVFGIVLVIGIIVALNQNALKESGAKVFLAVVLHNTIGLVAGYFGARLLKCDKRSAITVAIETGMQNSGLAVALSKQFFGIATALPGAIFSVWHNISGAIYASLVRAHLQKKDHGNE